MVLRTADGKDQPKIGDQGDLSNGKLYSIKVDVSDKEAAITNEILEIVSGAEALKG